MPGVLRRRSQGRVASVLTAGPSVRWGELGIWVIHVQLRRITELDLRSCPSANGCQRYRKRTRRRGVICQTQSAKHSTKVRFVNSQKPMCPPHTTVTLFLFHFSVRSPKAMDSPSTTSRALGQVVKMLALNWRFLAQHLTVLCTRNLCSRGLSTLR